MATLTITLKTSASTATGRSETQAYSLRAADPAQTSCFTLAAARAAAEGIAALQRGEVNVQALQRLHAERLSSTR